MYRSQYYENLKDLAREERKKFKIEIPRVLKSDFHRIYKFYQIQMDYWSFPKRNLRGAYINDDFGTTIVINRDLPDDPMIFTMAHELKHHLVDSKLVNILCGSSNINEIIEIGAEVFAAEFLFPDDALINYMISMGIIKGLCEPEVLVKIKHETKTSLSYSGLAKKTEFLGYAPKGAFTNNKIQWKRLEEALYGIPNYRQINFRRRKIHN